MDTIDLGIRKQDPELVHRGCREVLRQLRERPRECPQTLSREKALYELAFANGLFSLINPGGYLITVWKYAGMVMPQQGYGLVTTLFALYAAGSYWHGNLKHRAIAAVVGMVIAGVVGTFIFIANHFALPIPVFGWIVYQRCRVLWEMGQEWGRAHPPAP